MLDPHFLIFSSQRCGTNLQWACLNAHSQIRCVGEHHILEGLFQAGKHAHLLGEKIKWKNEIRRMVWNVSSQLFPEIVGSKFIYGLQLIGCHNASVVPDILELWPNVPVFLHVRDPRDIFLSYLKTGVGSGQSVRCLLKMDGMLRLNLKKNSYHLSKYEDMVKNGTSFFRFYCKKIGTQYEETMTDPINYWYSSYEKDSLPTIEKWRHINFPIKWDLDGVDRMYAAEKFGYIR